MLPLIQTPVPGACLGWVTSIVKLPSSKPHCASPLIFFVCPSTLHHRNTCSFIPPVSHATNMSIFVWNIHFSYHAHITIYVSNFRIFLQFMVLTWDKATTTPPQPPSRSWSVTSSLPLRTFELAASFLWNTLLLPPSFYFILFFW